MRPSLDFTFCIRERERFALARRQVPNRFDHASDAEVFYASQHALTAAADEVHRCFAEGRVGESDPVKWLVDELGDACVRQGR